METTDLSQLIDCLANPDSVVRERSARSLAEIGPRAEAATPALIERLTDEAQTVRTAAAFALSQVRPNPSLRSRLW